jgi:hypothetical protein
VLETENDALPFDSGVLEVDEGAPNEGSKHAGS